MNDPHPDSIAIIGMACRLPGAPDVAAFWRNLVDGVESITRFAPAALEDSFPPATRARPEYIAARPILEDVERFDAGFFGFYPREAAVTDPQQRVFLECAWEAFEDAGYDPAAYPGAVGVFAGASMNTYFLQHICQDRAAIEEFTSGFQLSNYTTLVGAADFVATRTAYKLGLRGPAMSLQSACSTSLVAVAQACQSLLLYQSDMALAGGVSISFPQRRGYLHQDGGMASGDGHCRTFDAKASGTIFGSGAGAVLLKRLDEALADGDHIYAVIRGAATNNDGADKVGFTAPSVGGQVAVVTAALAIAGVAPRSISYIECHGTATPLGDPIEVAALTKVFRADTDDFGFCTLGSVKTNIGHLDAAAGVAGLIKTVLALHHGKLPGTLHYETPNPRLELETSPFVVSARLTDWQRGATPRRAGVTALGVGGTNAHIVLEEAPEPVRPAAAAPGHLLVLSARSDTALAVARSALGAHLRAHPGDDLADIAFTLQVGRRAFAHRSVVVCADREDALRKLDDAVPSAVAAEAAPPVAFLFPGQGSQYPQMGRGLYDHEPVFRAAVDRCADILRPLLGLDLRTLLYPENAPADADNPLRATALAQPAIFTIEYATAQLWLAWGIRPAAMVGHSVGEFVAACIGGTIALEDALAVIAARGEMMQALPGGAMLAVRLAEADLEPLLPAGVSIAAVNGPSLCVAAGPFEAIADLEATLQAHGAMGRRLHTSHAFHSAMMDPVLPALAERLGAVALHPPTIPWVSGVTGQWITAEEATSPAYWARHCREKVRFAEALATLCAEEPALLEVGPGRALGTLARQGAGRGRLVAASLPDAERQPDDRIAMLEALGALWKAGVRPDWPAVGAPRTARRVSLPTYPFERVRYWVDAPAPTHAQPIPSAAIAAQPDETAMPQPVAAVPVAAAPATADARKAALVRRIIDIVKNLSGEDIGEADATTSFLELGFDSLFLGQLAQQLDSRMGLAVAFRDLLGDLPTIAALAEHATRVLPPEPEPEAAPVVATPAPAPALAVAPAGDGSVIENVMREQLAAMQALMARQLDALRGVAPAATPAAVAAPAPQPAAPAAAPAQPPAPAPEAAETPSRFAVYRPGAQTAASALAPGQQHHVDALIARYARRTAGSREYTERHRPTLADPRAASGFRAEWKEMVYPIVCTRSQGARIWDIDGNEYIDLVNGFGQTAFGHAAPFVADAVAAQLREGFAIGPQSPLAGEVAALICELTGADRATFCNTGSEAVMAAMRVARTVTGRERVVVFGGAYHGQFDEVLVKGARGGEPRALPVAPGIPPGSVQNIVVLPYATPESLEWVRAHAAELAAVIVEPVQSRHPSLRPQEFLAELRAITERAGTAFVFDEVVTGFRTHPGGMQALFGIRADMATYGKVVGGGMPIGVLAGSTRFMDALDGGQWRYGDDSYPMVAPTFFAGTFVRHPLTLAAAKAVLLYLKEQGPALQEALAARTASLVARLNATLAAFGIKSRCETFSSWFYLTLAGDQRFGSLLWFHLRDRGIHVQEGFPCFLTTEHGQAECDRIVEAFTASLREMVDDGVLEPTEPRIEAPTEEWIEAPPTEPQREIWLAAQLGDAASCAFNEGVSLRFDGRLDVAALTGALNDVIARHDSLRTVFSPTGEQLRVAPHLVLDLPVTDLETAGNAGLDALIEEEARTPLNLVDGPLLRARLARLGADRHVLVFTAHHIICDGWSINVIISELAECYTARSGGAAAELGPVLPFSRYAAAAQPDEAALAYWTERFAAPPSPLELPTDRPRAAQKTFAGATWRDAIDVGLCTAVKKAGARHGCTLFVTLLAAFQALLGRLADANDVVVGIPAAGQSAVVDRVLVGHCVNFLPLRATWQDATPVPTLLKAVRQTVLDAYEHQNCTLGTLVGRLDLPREAGRLPLVEVQFNLERLGRRLALPGLAVEVTPNPKRFVNFDLFLNIIESDQGLRIDVDYSTEMFDAATIGRWIDHYRTVLAAIAADADREIRRLPLLSPTERTALLVTGNATTAPFPQDMPLDALIAAQAARTPERIALTCGDTTVTYGEMQRRVDRLAHRLRRAVASPSARIGVMVQRSPDMVIAMLGVLRAGFAYVPVDPSHPAARIRNVFADAAIALLITDTGETTNLVAPGIPALPVHEPAPQVAPEPPPPLGTHGADGLAYTIYTSGSTGRPKGVEVGHRALVNLLSAMASKPGMQTDDRMLAVTTIAFDIAGLELFLPLTIGAEVVIARSEEVRDGFALVRRIADCRPTMMQATPSLWRMLLDAGFQPDASLRMLCGGEALDRALADRLLAGGGELWNMYGPTETTIWSSTERILPDGAPITVGRPIANTRFYVLDRHAEPCPPGVTGELFIAGTGLANGYAGQRAVTDAAFRSIGLQGLPTERMYATGDLARLLADGRIQIAGRRDGQVKLRGFRIELGEIETVLARVGRVAAAAVTVRETAGDQRLVGYFTERPDEPREPAEMAQALAAELPDYMVPALWVRLDAMPLTPNGKVDRRALPTPDAAAAISVAPPEPPRSELETTLLDIWREVLGTDHIGIRDNLFALGADSIHMFRIAARMMHAGIALGARDLLQHPTIADLAAVAATAAALPPVLSLAAFARQRRERKSA